MRRQRHQVITITLCSNKGLGFIFFQVAVVKSSMHDPREARNYFPITLATSLIEGEEFSNNLVQTCCKLVAFSLVSCIVIVIVTEFITNPRRVSTCVGMKVVFSGCTTKPNLSSRTVVSMTFRTHFS